VLTPHSSSSSTPTVGWNIVTSRRCLLTTRRIHFSDVRAADGSASGIYPLDSASLFTISSSTVAYAVLWRISNRRKEVINSKNGRERVLFALALNESYGLLHKESNDDRCDRA
jgi:hypothetical protein